MTDITHEEVRDALPDLIHGNLDAEQRAVLENHLRSCAECASEMRVLQMVKDAPSFAPMVDAVKIASVIPPYGGVPVERPRISTRVWQMAAFATVAVALIAVTLVSRGTQTPAPTPTPAVVVSTPVAGAAPSATPTSVPAQNAVKPPAVKPARELQVAGLDGLSDGSVEQLARELDGLDGLPSAEPENLGVGDPTSAGGSGQ
jgi:anti-sigma factor RsiW